MASDPFGAIAGSAPGWFGKLPALGDFASRRLPESFTAAWDPWLSGGIESTRAQLGERWLDVYLSGPVWSFALLPGTIDTNTWYGVMMPSVDRVGRYYPLTIATATDYAVPPANLDAWMQTLRDTALACLDPQATIDQLEATLAPQLLMPAGPWIEASMPRDGQASLWQARPEGFAATLAGTGASMLWRGLAGCSLWWTPKAAGVAMASPSMTVCRGLPGPAAFLSLLEGR
ncbi:type VI secretion system-associated protein TagF [soil metagenome]